MPYELFFWIFIGLAPIINIILICITLYRREYLSRLTYGTMILISLGLIGIWSSSWNLPQWLILGYLAPSLILMFFTLRSTYNKKPWKWWKIVKERKLKD